MITIDITVDGKAYKVDITNNMFLLGELIINEVKKQIRSMNLIGGDVGAGSYLQRWSSQVTNDGVRVESGVEYSSFLEFGTYTFFNIFGVEGFPRAASMSKGLKKKDLPLSLRKALPKGMVPFAPVRRVVNNPVIMKKLVKKAFA